MWPFIKYLAHRNAEQFIDSLSGSKVLCKAVGISQAEQLSCLYCRSKKISTVAYKHQPIRQANKYVITISDEHIGCKNHKCQGNLTVIKWLVREYPWGNYNKTRSGQERGINKTISLMRGAQKQKEQCRQA